MQHSWDATRRRLASQPRASQPVASLASLDTRAFRRTMGLFATGVTVITARMNGSVNGMTANAVTSVSLDPLLVLAAIDRRASMSNIIQQAGEFAINILSQRQEELSRHFAGAKIRPQPASLRFESHSDDGAPYIVDTLAAIRCRVARVLDGGDHVILLGRVVHFRAGPPASPLVYFGDRYCSVRDLPAPSTANSAADSFRPVGRRVERARRSVSEVRDANQEILTSRRLRAT